MTQIPELAIRYATALFEVVEAGEKQAGLLAQLRSIQKAICEDPVVFEFFLSPVVRLEEKQKVLSESFKKQPLDPLIDNFLKVLLKRDRLYLLEKIVLAFEKKSDEKHHVTRGEVRSAVPLTADERLDLEKMISRLAQKNVILNYRTDPEVLGGLKAQVGGLLFDDSVENHLKRLKDELNRSAQ